ncbi:hypothetical protein [Eubacterium sp.]|uniref:hypothetical protein n=1 Tax=Eubacterium sp. TaxID=142586 RepID=UPI003AF1091B
MAFPELFGDAFFLTIRKKVYEEARKSHPKRWQKKRDWSFSEEEWLNQKQKRNKKETKNEVKAS